MRLFFLVLLLALAVVFGQSTLSLAAEEPPPGGGARHHHHQESRKGISRFDPTYAAHLADSVHAPDAALLGLAALPLPRPGRVAFLGVPPPPVDGGGDTTTPDTSVVVFEHRPYLASTSCSSSSSSSSTVYAERPMTAKRLAPGSQHRIVVHSPLYLAQFDCADRLRVLKNCARWLHPSLGVLVLRFLDGGPATQQWCTRRGTSSSYQCEATLAPVTRSQPTPWDDVGVCHLRETIGGGGASYASLVFANPESAWLALVKRAGLTVVQATRDDRGAVCFVCRPSTSSSSSSQWGDV